MERSVVNLNSYNGAKAGMDGIDKDEIARIIYEATKDTPIGRKEAKEKQIAAMQAEEAQRRVRALERSPFFYQAITKAALNRIMKKFIPVDLSRTWLHIDMDMFYAAVEIRDKPELAAIPFVVAGAIVTTSNYIARKFGIRSAMPTFVARKLCPDLTVIRPHFGKYYVYS